MTPAFTLVPRLRGRRDQPARHDRIFAEEPSKPDERVLRLRLRCESPRCALDTDPEAGACDLRCPACGGRGSWESGRTCEGALVEPDASQMDLEPYAGRKRVPDESPEVWRCRSGHETKEPLRPRKEPRSSSSGRTKAPTAGRNAVEDRILVLCDCRT